MQPQKTEQELDIITLRQEQHREFSIQKLLELGAALQAFYEKVQDFKDRFFAEFNNNDYVTKIEALQAELIAIKAKARIVGFLELPLEQLEDCNRLLQNLLDHQSQLAKDCHDQFLTPLADKLWNFKYAVEVQYETMTGKRPNLIALNRTENPSSLPSRYYRQLLEFAIPSFDEQSSIENSIDNIELWLNVCREFEEILNYPNILAKLSESEPFCDPVKRDQLLIASIRKKYKSSLQFLLAMPGANADDIYRYYDDNNNIITVLAEKVTLTQDYLLVIERPATLLQIAFELEWRAGSEMLMRHELDSCQECSSASLEKRCEDSFSSSRTVLDLVISNKDTKSLKRFITCLKNVFPCNSQDDFSLAAFLSKKNGFGSSFLELAVSRGNNEIVTCLLENGAKPNGETQSSQHSGSELVKSSPLHLAMSNESDDNVKKLFEYDAQLHVKDSNGKVPLQLAIELGAISKVKILLKAYYNKGRFRNDFSDGSDLSSLLRMLIYAIPDCKDKTKLKEIYEIFYLYIFSDELKVPLFLVEKGYNNNLGLMGLLNIQLLIVGIAYFDIWPISNPNIDRRQAFSIDGKDFKLPAALIEIHETIKSYNDLPSSNKPKSFQIGVDIDVILCKEILRLKLLRSSANSTQAIAIDQRIDFYNRNLFIANIPSVSDKRLISDEHRSMLKDIQDRIISKIIKPSFDCGLKYVEIFTDNHNSIKGFVPTGVRLILNAIEEVVEGKLTYSEALYKINLIVEERRKIDYTKCKFFKNRRTAATVEFYQWLDDHLKSTSLPTKLSEPDSKHRAVRR